MPVAVCTLVLGKVSAAQFSVGVVITDIVTDPPVIICSAIALPQRLSLLELPEFLKCDAFIALKVLSEYVCVSE